MWRLRRLRRLWRQRTLFRCVGFVGFADSGGFFYVGGCQLAPTQRRLAQTTVRLFIFKAETVTRPVGVLPEIRVPLSDHSN